MWAGSKYNCLRFITGSHDLPFHHSNPKGALSVRGHPPSNRRSERGFALRVSWGEVKVKVKVKEVLG